jgi:hypothetical protein
MKKHGKGQDIDEQIDDLKENIVALNQTIDKYRSEKETSDESDSEAERDEESENDKEEGSEETPTVDNVKKKRSKKKKFAPNNSKPRRSIMDLSPYYNDKVYTVKNAQLPPNASNKYLRAIRSSPISPASYDAKRPKSFAPYGKSYVPQEYKIKTYGKAEGRKDERPATSKSTVKSAGYFRKKSSCSKGCSKG